MIIGGADIAMLSNDLPSIADAVEFKRSEIVDRARLVEFPIGQNEIQFIVNSANPVAEMTIDQLAGILSGKTGNWRDVGGSDAPILVIVAASGNQYPDIADAILKSRSFTRLDRTRRRDSLQSGLLTARAVAQSPNSIGYRNSLVTSDQPIAVKPLAIDIHIMEPLSLVTFGSPTADAKKLIEAVAAIMPHDHAASPTPVTP